MIRTKDELITIVKDALGDNITSDKGIALLEDINDTFADSKGGSTKELEDKIAELEKEKEELDKTWRDKYVARFESGTPSPKNEDDPNNETDEDDDKPEKEKFEDLFAPVE